MNRIFLLPGQMHMSRGEDIVTTILGSCVSLILFDTRTRLSVMTHYVLPEFFAKSGQLASARYGDYALEKGLAFFQERGVKTSHLQGKLYGGANMSEGNSIGEAIGASNILFGVQNLAILGIPTVEENLGGFLGRKITFNSFTFSVEHQFQQSNSSLVS